MRCVSKTGVGCGEDVGAVVGGGCQASRWKLGQYSMARLSGGSRECSMIPGSKQKIERVLFYDSA